MNDDHIVTAETLLRILPMPLAEDPEMKGLAEAVAGSLSEGYDAAGSTLVYPRIDGLPADLLDILARDLKIDWWDPDASVEEKRRVLKQSRYVHRHLGTKGAVERAIGAVYEDTTLEEWFEYDGEPYHFRLSINISDDNIDSDRMRRALNRLQWYKNLRSHNDGITYFTRLKTEPKVQARYARTGYIARLWVESPPVHLEKPTYTTTALAGVGQAISGVLHTER